MPGFFALEKDLNLKPAVSKDDLRDSIKRIGFISKIIY
jgi:hypothetical protein